MKIPFIRKAIFITSLFLSWGYWIIPTPGLGQEMGYPFIKNITADEYRAHSQNFAIGQDHRGVMYFGNFSGILEYDGEWWRLIPTGNITKVSSLSTDPNGRIFVGARGEIGYLTPDTSGQMAFISLHDFIPAGYADFTDVGQTFATKNGVYFVTAGFILFYDGEKISVIRSEGSILSSFCIHDDLYCWVRERGLVRYNTDREEILVDQEDAGGILEIKAMILRIDGSLLVVTANQGLYVLSQGSLERFTTSNDKLLERAQISCGILLPDRSFALGSEREGLIIVAPDGHIIQTIDKQGGLRNDNITSLFLDREHNLWAALNNGIALIEIPSPLSCFDERHGISGGVTGITRMNDRLFVSTYQGLYVYEPSANYFRAIPEITTGCWSITPFGDDLLAATSKGIYLVGKGSPKLVASGFCFVICRSGSNPERIYVGQTDGMRILEGKENAWIDKGMVPEVNHEIVELAEDQEGRIWMNTFTRGILRYSPDDPGTVEVFDTTNGLPYMTGNHLCQRATGVHISTRQGLYTYNDDLKAFEIYPLFPDDSANQTIWLKLTVEDMQKNVWITRGDEKGISLYRKPAGEGFELLTTPFLPVKDFVTWIIYPENNGIAWFGGPEGMIRYDPAVGSNYDIHFQTLIRKLTIRDDSTVFWGTFYDSGLVVTYQPPGHMRPLIGYAQNSVLFEFSAASYDANSRNEYRYFLEGFDKIWTEWRGENSKEYTNLPKGDYMFHVQSKNVYDRISEDSTFAFRILTPWYLLWWAYVLYALLAGIIIYLIVLFRSRKLLKEKQALEAVIQERTAEVVRQKEEIEHKSLELADKNYELEKINTVVKSINEEIHFARLLESVLEKLTAVKGVEKALALVRDQSAQVYRFKASYGWEMSDLAGVTYDLEEIENRYLKDSLEIFEDIFIKSDPGELASTTEFSHMVGPRSVVMVVIKVEEKVEGMLLLVNMTKENAFDMRDLGFIRNAKEHIISAFIKTRILEDLQQTLENLKETQKQLIQSEKLASLGQLTAGIAHEIQNPLNFVNNFSSLSMDLIKELREVMDQEKESLAPESLENLEEVVGMLDANVKKINEHGQRAERIVKGMLQHSRGKSGEFLSTDMNALVEEYINLAYHGMRAENKEFNATFIKALDPEVGRVKVVPQDFSRVILNIMNNACYAVFEKSQRKLPGYTPTITVSTKRSDQQIEIRIKDNGTGIPQAIIDKIFNPFFTTKPTGKGTGLGLSMSYDIVTNIHGGKLDVISLEGESSEFIITIPDKS